jgi:hypothetical protein
MRRAIRVKLEALCCVIGAVEAAIEAASCPESDVVHYMGQELAMLQEKRRLLIENYAPKEVK